RLVPVGELKAHDVAGPQPAPGEDAGEAQRVVSHAPGRHLVRAVDDEGLSRSALAEGVEQIRNGAVAPGPVSPILRDGLLVQSRLPLRWRAIHRPLRRLRPSIPLAF